MIPAGQIVENVLRAALRTTSAEKRTEAWQLLNAAYFQLCREHPFSALRTYIDLNFASTDGGMWLPSDLFGVRRVYDNTNDIEFLPIDSSEVDPEEGGYRFYCKPGATEDLFFSEDCSIDHGGATFTCSELTDDHTGKQVTFGTELGYYTLTASKTITPTYYGPTIDSEEVRIRPKETQKMVIIDGSEDELDDRTVRVHYWKAPSPLYRDSDMPCIPHASVLELMVLSVMPEARSRRPVSQQDVEEAKRQAKMANPDNPRPARPRDIHNKRFTLTGGGYGGR